MPLPYVDFETYDIAQIKRDGRWQDLMTLRTEQEADAAAALVRKDSNYRIVSMGKRTIKLESVGIGVAVFGRTDHTVNGTTLEQAIYALDPFQR